MVKKTLVPLIDPCKGILQRSPIQLFWPLQKSGLEFLGNRPRPEALGRIPHTQVYGFEPESDELGWGLGFREEGTCAIGVVCLSSGSK